MRSPHKSFLLRIFLLLGLVLVTVGTFNIVIDPYNRFGNNRLGIYIMSAEREFKATKLRKQTNPYDTILLGDSRAAMIDVGELGFENAFNASFGGAQMAELYHLIKAYIFDCDLVLLGIKLGQMAPEPETSCFFEEMGARTVLPYILNLKTLEYSFQVVAKYLKKAPRRILDNGSSNPARWYATHSSENPEERATHLHNLIQEYLNYAPFESKNMLYYEKIKRLLEERDIPYKTFIYPTNEEVLAGIRGSKTIPELNAWKQRLFSIFPETVDLSDSEYSGSEGYLSTDLVHFQPRVGNIFLKREVLCK